MTTTLVVLAAGVGSRLRPLTDRVPKCLVQVGGATLLDRLIDTFNAYVDDVIVVTGYLAQMVDDHLGTTNYDLGVRVVHNDRYAVTNSMYSAHTASPLWVDSDTVFFTNCDVLLSTDALEAFARTPTDFSALVVPRSCDQEDMKVRLSDDGLRVERISKEISLDSAYGEFTGVFRATRSGIPTFRQILSELVQDENMRTRGWYDLAVDALCHQHTVAYCDIDDGHYIEIDTLDDLESARSRAQASSPGPVH